MIVDRFNVLKLTTVLDASETVNKFVYLKSNISNTGRCQAVAQNTDGKKCTEQSDVPNGTFVATTIMMRLNLRNLGTQTQSLKEQKHKKLNTYEMWYWRRMLLNPSVVEKLKITTTFYLSNSNAGVFRTYCAQRISQPLKKR